MATELKTLIVLTLLDTTDALWEKEPLNILHTLMETRNPDLLCSIQTGQNSIVDRKYQPADERKEYIYIGDRADSY